MKLRLPPWFLFFPIILISIEVLLSRFYPFSSPYFSLLLVKQPVALTAQCVVALARVYAAYCFFAVTIELATRAIKHTAIRILIFLVLFGLSVYFSLRAFPGLIEQFPNITPRRWLFCAALLAGSLFVYRKAVYAQPLLFKSLAFTLLFLVATRNSPWENLKSAPSVPSLNKPSFALLSFDAVPGDLFNWQEKEKSVAPLFQSYWKDKGQYFNNAYTLTNSTYTSWFSLLTGKTPSENGVLSLYPSNREGSISEEEWLPAKLRAEGYHSVFLTDCANTSFMEKSSGFSRTYQPDKGAFGSARALVTSVHPGLYWVNQLAPTQLFFPELVSFSSHQYDPQSFFDLVKSEWKRLEASEAPYFLVVHSCLTHRDLAHHLPAEGEVELSSLPSFHGFRSKGLLELMSSLRTADKMAHEFLSYSDKARKPAWRFLLSDHGIRMDPNEGELTLFSHAIGDAVSRFQYNVPLFVLPPPSMSLAKTSEQLVTIQDLSKVLLQLATGEPPNNWRYPTHSHLKLTSAVPSQTPGHWGQTLVPLVQNGKLDSDGTFRFEEKDEAFLNKHRSHAILKLPFRGVLGENQEWKLFDELKDPFHQTDLIETTPSAALWLEELRDNPSSVLMVN